MRAYRWREGEHTVCVGFTDAEAVSFADCAEHLARSRVDIECHPLVFEVIERLRKVARA